MAMTKKERAAFDAALEKARLLGALRWTSPVERDLQRPVGNDMISGWEFNAFYRRVFEEWSCSHSNGSGKSRGISANQNGKSLYSSKLMALKALRNETEKEAARKLAQIDLMIEQELESGQK